MRKVWTEVSVEVELGKREPGGGRREVLCVAAPELSWVSVSE